MEGIGSQSSATFVGQYSMVVSESQFSASFDGQFAAGSQFVAIIDG